MSGSFLQNYRFERSCGLCLLRIQESPMLNLHSSVILSLYIKLQFPLAKFV